MVKKLFLSFVFLSLVTILISANNLDENQNLYTNPLENFEAEYFVYAQPIDNNSLSSMSERYRYFIIPPQPIVIDDNSLLKNPPDRRRNDIIPPRPIPPDGRKIVKYSSPDFRRTDIIILPEPIYSNDQSTLYKSFELYSIQNEYEVSIYDIKGRKVSESIKMLPSGKYLMLLKNGKTILTKKLVIMK